MSFFLSICITLVEVGGIHPGVLLRHCSRAEIRLEHCYRRKVSKSLLYDLPGLSGSLRSGKRTSYLGVDDWLLWWREVVPSIFHLDCWIHLPFIIIYIWLLDIPIFVKFSRITFFSATRCTHLLVFGGKYPTIVFATFFTFSFLHKHNITLFFICI